MAHRVVALIPARQGSKRVPGKNVRRLQGHPMLAYSIASALDSGVFERVIVSTDAEEVAEVARHYGAEVPFLRPPALASDVSPDIEWLDYTLRELRDRGQVWDAFSLLRPTSPFRTAGRSLSYAWRGRLTIVSTTAPTIWRRAIVSSSKRSGRIIFITRPTGRRASCWSSRPAAAARWRGGSTPRPATSRDRGRTDEAFDQAPTRYI